MDLKVIVLFIIKVHSSTKHLFLVNTVEILKWFANSPDLSAIENLWGDLALRVYVNGKRFSH